VLDAFLTKQVKERFDHRNINLDVPEFADGKLVPTGENLARFIFERVERAAEAGESDARDRRRRRQSQRDLQHGVTEEVSVPFTRSNARAFLVAMAPFALTACVTVMKTAHLSSPRSGLRLEIDSLTSQPSSGMRSGAC